MSDYKYDVVIFGFGRTGEKIYIKKKEIHNAVKILVVENNTEIRDNNKGAGCQFVGLSLTDDTALEQVEIHKAKEVIITLGENSFSDVLCIVAFLETKWDKEYFSKHLTVRVYSDIEEKTLHRYGVYQTIYASKYIAEVMHRLTEWSGVIDVEALHDNFYMITIHVPEKFNGLTIEECKFMVKYNLLASIYKTSNQIFIPCGKQTLDMNNMLKLIGHVDNINTFLKENINENTSN